MYRRLPFEISAHEFRQNSADHIDSIENGMPHPRDFLNGIKQKDVFGNHEENTNHREYHSKIINHLRKSGLNVEPIYKKKGNQDRLHTIQISIPDHVEHANYFPSQSIPVALHHDTMLYTKKRDEQEDLHDAMVKQAANYIRNFHNFTKR